MQTTRVPPEREAAQVAGATPKYVEKRTWLNLLGASPFGVGVRPVAGRGCYLDRSTRSASFLRIISNSFFRIA
jgi:hypothetical protein